MLHKSYYLLPIITFFFVIFTYHTLYRHWTYNSNAFDLGIYTQAIHLYSQGATPISTLKHMDILGDHFGPILFLLSPIYKLFPYPEILLIIQALFVSLSGIFIYLIALDKLKDNLKSILIACAYLSFSGILTAVNFDFHLATISVFPLSLILYAYYFKRYKLYFLSLFFALLFKEDIPIFIVGLGLMSILQKQTRIGVLTTILGFLSYYLIKYQIMGKLYPGAENGYIDSIKPLSLIVNYPTKVYTLITLYGQFLFLPFLSILSWITVLPYLLIRFSSSLPHYWGLHFHYNANLAPFLATSAIFTLAKIKIPNSQIIAYLILTLLMENLFFNRLILDTLQLNIKDIQKFSYINSSLEIIPPQAVVSVQSPIVPHLSNRNKIYLYPEVLDAEYIVLDESLIYYPMQNEEFMDKISSLKSSPNWTLDQQNNSLLIFKKNNSY